MKMAKKLTALILALILTLSIAPGAFAADKATLDSAVNDTAAYIYKTVKNPIVGSVGGEWAVIGLARSNYTAPDSYYAAYYKAVEKYVKDCGGVLDSRKYTEYSRVILGLTAAGYDPTSVGGYDLTAPLEDFDKTIWQGINGPIWALIALDSGNYANTQRDNYIAEILDKQLPDGGWDLANQSSDPDMTGMALQALANYQDKPEVKTAIDKALKISFSYKTSEGVVQMLVANATLGKSTDALVDELLKYRNSDGSFNHVLGSDDGNNQMATEQALYGLVAAQRARDGKSPLYKMSDTNRLTDNSEQLTITGLPNKNKDVKVVPITVPGRTFPDVKGHANQTAIEKIAERGIINGMTSDANADFAPDATMTRAQFAAIITRGLGLAARPGDTFTDVPANDFYNGFIGAAYYYGIVKGSNAEGTEFTPSGNITRQDAAVMVARAAKLCGFDTDLDEVTIRDTLAQFGDYRTVSDYAKAPLAFCFANGILDDSELDIEPTVAIKRCEIAEMLYRLLDKAELLK